MIRGRCPGVPPGCRCPEFRGRPAAKSVAAAARGPGILAGGRESTVRIPLGFPCRREGETWTHDRHAVLVAEQLDVPGEATANHVAGPRRVRVAPASRRAGALGVGEPQARQGVLVTTGGLETRAVVALGQAGRPVVAVNPRQLRYYAIVQYSTFTSRRLIGQISALRARRICESTDTATAEQ